MTVAVSGITPKLEGGGTGTCHWLLPDLLGR